MEGFLGAEFVAKVDSYGAGGQASSIDLCDHLFRNMKGILRGLTGSPFSRFELDRETCQLLSPKYLSCNQLWQSSPSYPRGVIILT